MTSCFSWQHALPFLTTPCIKTWSPPGSLPLSPISQWTPYTPKSLVMVSLAPQAWRLFRRLAVVLVQLGHKYNRVAASLDQNDKDRKLGWFPWFPSWFPLASLGFPLPDPTFPTSFRVASKIFVRCAWPGQCCGRTCKTMPLPWRLSGPSGSTRRRTRTADGVGYVRCCSHTTGFVLYILGTLSAIHIRKPNNGC